MSWLSSNKLSNKQIGYKYLTILTFLLVIGEVIFRYIAESEIEETVIKNIIIVLPLIFVYLGYKWAKWATSIILILNGILSIIGSFELNSQSLWIVGLINIFFGVVVHTSKKICAIFIDTEEFSHTGNTESKTEILTQHEFPYLITRIKASLIDGVILLSLFVAIIILTSEPENRPVAAVIFLIIAILYEPIMLTFFSATIGHKIMHIKVKKLKDTTRNLNPLQGIIRITTKFILGWLSFITINFNPEHRAIHDYLSSSVVLKGKTAHKNGHPYATPPNEKIDCLR